MNARTRTSERSQEGTVNRLSRPESASGAAPLPRGVRGARGGSGAAPDARYRFLARFGATILSGGIAAIPTSLYHYQAQLGLVPQEVWFVGYILAHRWTDALPYPSLRQMGRRTGISTQMLHRYKQSLVEKGYLAIIPRHRPSGGRTSNFYDFTGLFDRLEQLLRGDRRGTAWQPTADDAAGDDLADAEPDGATDEDAEPNGTPATVLTEGVSPSHHAVGSEVVTWQDVLAQGRQRALSAPHPPPLTGATHASLPEGAPQRGLGLGTPAAPHESRPSAYNTYKTASRERVPTGAETSKRALRNASSPNMPGAGTGLPSLSTSTASTASTPPWQTWDRSLPRGTAEGLQPMRRRSSPSPADEASPNDSPATPFPPLPPTDDPAEQCWRAARAALARTISPAAFRAWLSGLSPVALVSTPEVATHPSGSAAAAEPGIVPATDTGGHPADPPAAPAAAAGTRLVLACASNFQREHLERRYRDAIEAALGTRCELVVRTPLSAPDGDER